MKPRHRAAPLVTFTIGFLVVYAPIETWYSFPTLWDPFYLVDFIGIVLLGWGAVRCRRDPSPYSLALLTAGYAWEGANFWRGLFGRVQTMASGGALEMGWAELCFTACVMTAALGGLIWSVRLAASTPIRAETGHQTTS